MAEVIREDVLTCLNCGHAQRESMSTDESSSGRQGCRHRKRRSLVLRRLRNQKRFGETVTATLAKECCDREIMAWRAWPGKGLPGMPVREMLIEAVAKRFGAVEALPEGRTLEFLTDNGGAYTAHDTRRVARDPGPQAGEHACVQPAEQRHGR